MRSENGAHLFFLQQMPLISSISRRQLIYQKLQKNALVIVNTQSPIFCNHGYSNHGYKKNNPIIAIIKQRKIKIINLHKIIAALICDFCSWRTKENIPMSTTPLWAQKWLYFASYGCGIESFTGID